MDAPPPHNPPHNTPHPPQDGPTQAQDAHTLEHAQTFPKGIHPDGARAGPVERRRDLFWQNVVRESLMALAAAAQSSTGRTSPTPSGVAHSPSPVGELFDGRIAVITHLGQRIPIADLHPVFACSISGSPQDRVRSADVQCTVFRITTPSGETFTLPLSQIAMVHALSDALIRRLEAAAEAQAAALEVEEEDKLPFGFAAYTSLKASEDESDPVHPAI
ncbi:MAG: hypothetical protein ACF8Q5_08600 [Phycisphaerales bacterium JB040]